MVVVADGVWCDPCLEPLVRALNSGGLRTVASCCGHGRRPGSVALADGRWVMVATEEQYERLSEGWPDINAALSPQEETP
jgi:hypothetical protein